MSDHTMRQNDTPSDLTLRQSLALEPLIAGTPITDVAAIVGVDRTTIHRWLKQDDAFIRAVYDGREAIRQLALGRLMALTLTALDVVESAIAEGSVRESMEVLKGVGLLGGPGNPVRATVRGWSNTPG